MRTCVPAGHVKHATARGIYSFVPAARRSKRAVDAPTRTVIANERGLVGIGRQLARLARAYLVFLLS